MSAAERVMRKNLLTLEDDILSEIVPVDVFRI
jgi:hypothetical protein